MELQQHGGTQAGSLGLIDHDHTEMDRHIHAIRQSLDAGDGQATIGRMLESLTRFSHLHFALEDSIMNATCYPEAALHRKHHQWLVLEMETLSLAFARGQGSAGPDSLKLLFERLASHLMEDDKAVMQWLNHTQLD